MSEIDTQTDTPAEYFPQKFVDEIAGSLRDLLDDHNVVTRPLRQTDLNNSIGVYAAMWAADDSSQEIGQREPTEARYTIRVQNMVKSMVEQDGRAAFSLNAKLVRAILYRDGTLRVRLEGLQEELLGTAERVKRYKVMKQDFLTSELQGVFIFLASSEVWIDTETTAL